jgi:hypothetical protein
MLENHITINDLIAKEPHIGGPEKEWHATEASLLNFIQDGFNRTCIELSKLEIDTKKVLPIHLGFRVVKDMISQWVQASGLGEVKRLVVKLKEPLSEEFKLILEGTDDNGVSAERALTLVINNDYTSVTFLKEFNQYRYKIKSETALDKKANIYITETFYDDLIIYKSLENYFTAKYRNDKSNFSSKMQLYRSKFDTELQSLAEFFKWEGNPKSNITTIRVGL